MQEAAYTIGMLVLISAPIIAVVATIIGFLSIDDKLESILVELKKLEKQ